MSFQYMLYLHLLESRHTNVHVVYLCPHLESLGGARFSPTQISSAMFDTRTPFVVIN